MTDVIRDIAAFASIVTFITSVCFIVMAI